MSLDPASAGPDPRIGQTLGKYVVRAHVADGAMGRVYEGRDPITNDRVAIKVLHPDVAKDTVAVERFKREAETEREVAHAHVVQVLDFGQTPDGSFYMAMEFLQGEELGQLLRREKTVAIPRIVRIFSQLALGLDHAHSFGVVHRDLKPDNVFLCETPDGDVVRILDFGSVKLQVETGPKLTAFGTTLGSPFYMSPEQAMGKQDVDQRTDVFAMGAILYEMLTGRIAFEGNNVAQILMKIMNANPEPPSQVRPGVFPASLDDVVEKGIRKDKKKRYESAVELANAVIAALGLQGDAAQWAATPSTQIYQALQAATPAAPKPFGAESLPPPPPGGAPRVAQQAAPPSAMQMHDDVPAPKQGPNLLLIVGIGVGALVALSCLIGIASVFLLR